MEEEEDEQSGPTVLILGLLLNILAIFIYRRLNNKRVHRCVTPSVFYAFSQSAGNVNETMAGIYYLGILFYFSKKNVNFTMN